MMPLRTAGWAHHPTNMTTTTSFCCLGAGPLLERRRHPLTRRIFKHKNCVNASSTAGDPVAARNCSEILWQQHRHLYFLNLLNPFVQGMIHGNLPPEAFESYSSQDVYYLRVFKTAIAKLRETLTECSTWADKGEATKRKAIDNSESLLQSIDEEIETVHGSFITVDSIASNVGTRASCEATETYTNFLKQIMEQDPKPSHILASIIPCFRLYYELANEMKTHIMDMSGTLDDHPYAAWILHYSSREYLASVTSAEWILNQTLPIDSLTTPTGMFRLVLCSVIVCDFVLCCIQHRQPISHGRAVAPHYQTSRKISSS
jgi:thiaminase/transcriptional activator TenA